MKLLGLTLSLTRIIVQITCLSWMNVDQNLFKDDSRGNAVVPLTGSRNGARGQIFDGGHKLNLLKLYQITKVR
jgi:hypothetical protein